MQKRNHYRIEYPPAARPVLLIGGRSYEILNLSEQGLKYDHPGGSKPAIGEPLSGTIVFADRKRVEVEGSVLRVVGSTVVAHLGRGVPFGKIMAEQRRFLKLPPAA